MKPEWLVPGGAVVSDGSAKLRLRLPASWVRIVIDVWKVPPSMNTDESRGWRAFYKHKRAWQDEIETLLMVADPRGSYQRAVAGCVMRFPKHAARRDPSNFSGVVNKALGDSLVTRGLIPDDDGPHYHFSGVEFAARPGPAHTRILVFLQPKEQ
jgi:hypothetical protein